MNITLAKQRINLPDELFVILFSVYSEKTIIMMDQTLKGRSHHGLVNNFSKKDLGKILEN
jgi:hypothetical protein